MNTNMLKKGDIILVVLILAAGIIGYAAFSLYGKGGGDRIAVITQDDQVIRRINIDSVDEPERIEVGGQYPDTILVEKGRIRFEEAECPDQVCVKTGWLEKRGDVAVCLPNRTMIKIEGEGEKVDGTTY